MTDNSLWLCDACYKDIGSAQECYTDYNWIKKLCDACQNVVAVHHVVNRRDVTGWYPINDHPEIPS